jgi:hypothetical protein
MSILANPKCQILSQYPDVTGFLLILPLGNRNLEPGGFLELQDNYFPIKCDDGTMTMDTPLMKWTHLLVEATDKIGRSIQVAPTFKTMLEEAGFEDVVETKITYPHSPWAKDPKLKELGIWTQAGTINGIEAMTLALFTRVLGWSREETLVFCSKVRDDLRSVKIHGYWDL